MADEKLPNPDGILPGAPLSKPVPSYSQDVIYAGVPPPGMRSEAIIAGTPAAVPVPPAPPAQASRPAAPSLRSEISLFFCWLAGVFIILICGWGLIGSCCYVDRKLYMPISYLFAGGIGGLVSLVLLFLLEQNLWLSRFMGLKLGPHSTPLTETLFFFFTGILGLLLRHNETPAPAVAKSANENDGTREIVETVVFVVVLVLLLKTFLVEAFVIPTGSMADTLLGYHKDYTCDKCGYHFVVNCSSEAEPQPNQRERETIIGGYCPNCVEPNARN